MKESESDGCYVVDDETDEHQQLLIFFLWWRLIGGDKQPFKVLA